MCPKEDFWRVELPQELKGSLQCAGMHPDTSKYCWSFLKPRIGKVAMKPEACEESLVLHAAGNGIPALSAFPGGIGSVALKSGVLDGIVPAVLLAPM